MHRAEVRATIAHMCTDIARRWSLGELASNANLSPSRLNSLFKEELGITPLGMLTQLRVQEMTRMLRETGLTVPEIAHAVGWRDQAHAAQQFRKLTGLSPTEYRAETRRRMVAECFWCGQPLPAPGG